MKGMPGAAVVTVVIVLLSLALAATGSAILQDGFSPEVLAKVQDFQTIFASILASIAALFTALIVYWAALIPVRNANQTAEERKQASEITGASILLQGLNNVVLSLHQNLSSGQYQPVIIPACLSDYELLSTQSKEINYLSGNLARNIERSNRLVAGEPDAEIAIHLGRDMTLYDLLDTQILMAKLITISSDNTRNQGALTSEKSTVEGIEDLQADYEANTAKFKRDGSHKSSPD